MSDSNQVQRPQQDRYDDEIDLLQLIKTVWYGKVIIILITVVFVSLGVVFALNSPKVFQADALLQLEERSGGLTLPTGLSDLVSNDPRTETEIQLVRSRLVLGRVVAELNLDWDVTPSRFPVLGEFVQRREIDLPDYEFLNEFVRGSEYLELDYLQVPPEWADLEMILTSSGNGSYELELPNGSVIQGVVGDRVSIDERQFALQVRALDAPAAREFTITQISEGKIIENLRTNLGVAEKGRGSEILELTFKANDRFTASQVLGAVSRSYVEQNIKRSSAEADSSLDFLRAQIPAAAERVDEAVEALNAYRAKQNSVDVSFETEALLNQITTIETELAALQVQEDQISERYTRNHPTYQQLLRQRERLEARLQEFRSEASELPETQREVLALSQQLELAQQTYTQLLVRSQEVEVLRASTIGNVRLVDHATTKIDAVAPRSALIVALAGVLGLMAGVAVVLLRSMLRSGVRSGSELEALGLGLFATINVDSKEAKSGGKNRVLTSTLALRDPDSLVVESIKSLRTSLHFGMLDKPNKALALTSASPANGKSFLALNLAIVSAQAGQRVCIVDADMRRGTLRKRLGVARGQVGLADHLAGTATVDDITIKTPLDNLHAITTGRFPPNPSELLMRDKFAEFVAILDQTYDLIIFDCPPVLAVTDPIIISKAVGTTLFVARYATTEIGEVEASMTAFKGAGTSFSGAVLNGYDPKREKRSGGTSYAYHYRYNYKTSKD